MLTALSVIAAPAQAGPIGLRDVITLTSLGQASGPSVDLRLRSSEQQTGPATRQTLPIAGPVDQRGAAVPDGSGATPIASLTATEVQQPQAEQTNVETIELGEVNGTLCDCGDIFIPAGGFPKWPLLALAGLPLLFLDHGKTPPNFTEVIPTPTPTPPEVPEPATIFLLGSGLLALGARARRSRARQSKDESATEEV